MGSTGKTNLGHKSEEGDIVVSPFFAAAMIGDVGEVELFSVVTSSMWVTVKLKVRFVNIH